MEQRYQCTICHGNLLEAFKVNDYHIWECQKCSHRMTRPRDASNHVEEIYTDDYFLRGGAGYPDYLFESKILTQQGERYAHLMKIFFPLPGTLLDVGCSAGFVMQGFKKNEWKVIGVEPNKLMADFARENYGFEVHNSSIERISMNQQFDLICLIQVMAHFVDPDQVLKKISSLIKPGGYVLVETWNFQSCLAKLWGKNWHEYSPPTVLHWFNPQSLDILFHNHNFKKVSSGRPKKKISWSHAKSLLAYKYGQNKIANGILKVCNLIPDNLTLLYPSWDLFYTVYCRRS